MKKRGHQKRGFSTSTMKRPKKSSYTIFWWLIENFFFQTTIVGKSAFIHEIPYLCSAQDCFCLQVENLTTYSTLHFLFRCVLRKKINRWRSQFKVDQPRFSKSKKSWNRFFFCNENKADFVTRNHFTFANHNIRTGTIKTKVLLHTGWFYKLITLRLTTFPSDKKYGSTFSDKL